MLQFTRILFCLISATFSAADGWTIQYMYVRMNPTRFYHIAGEKEVRSALGGSLAMRFANAPGAPGGYITVKNALTGENLRVVGDPAPALSWKGTDIKAINLDIDMTRKLDYLMEVGLPPGVNQATLKFDLFLNFNGLWDYYKPNWGLVQTLLSKSARWPGSWQVDLTAKAWPTIHKNTQSGFSVDIGRFNNLPTVVFYMDKDYEINLRLRDHHDIVFTDDSWTPGH